METSFIDWEGRVSSVVFVGGCNFRCPYCHNHPLVLKPDQVEGRPGEAILEHLAGYKDWLDGVVITGGEPTLQPGLADYCRRLKEIGLPVKLDTNGTRPDVLAALIEDGLLEAVAMDIKGPLDEPVLHRMLAGVATDIARVEESIDLLLASGLEVEFRTTFIPGILTEEHLKKISQRVRGAGRYRINRFQTEACLDPEFDERQPMTDEDQERLQELVDGWMQG